MSSILKFWLPLLAILASWELGLLYPSWFWYWLVLGVSASLTLGFFMNPRTVSWQRYLPDVLAFMAFAASVFWWFFWLDLAYLKYVLAMVFWLVMAFAFVDIRNNRPRDFPAHWRLSLFLGGMFFSSSVCFGLLTVLGWPLWLALLIFLTGLAVFSWSAMIYLEERPDNLIRGFLFMLLLGAEVFSVLVWLPFTEVTLGLLLTIIMLAAYDMLKYLTKPELIVRRIIVKKLVVYVFFLVLVLASTPWQ